MVTLDQIKSITDYLLEKNIVASIEYVATEEMIADVMKNISKYPLMLFILPSFDSNSKSFDNFKFDSSMLIYFLSDKNALDGKVSLLKSLQNSEKTMLSFMDEIKKSNTDIKHPLNYIFKNFEPKIHIDPEYNYYGKNGYSMSFNL